MLTIYKYPFTIQHEFTVSMPRGARIVKVECQGDQPCIWAIVDTTQPTSERRFRIHGTGHELDVDGMSNYIATFQMPPFVWHLFKIMG